MRTIRNGGRHRPRAVATWAALGAALTASGLGRDAAAADPVLVPALTDVPAADAAPPADEPPPEEPATGATPQVAPLVVTG